MFLETLTNKGKYTTHLLRESFRENGKVMHRTIANLSHCNPETIEAMKLALKHKSDLTQLVCISDILELFQGPSVGAILCLHSVAEKIGLRQALGDTVEGKRALWQIMARVIDQGSRLSSVRLAGSHAVCDVLGLKAFNEEDLYKNLDWLCENQDFIEDALFQKSMGRTRNLFLYDVTSTYLEGIQNELAAFGYNRDGKKGKRQLVVGLLSDEEGYPLSVQVFEGNTQDPKTFKHQVKKVAERFGGKSVTFVGDRGMIKGRQIEDLSGEEFHYITAITKAQIETLLAKEAFQMSLFEENLTEVSYDGLRYVLRRNPVRAKEIADNRQDKIASLQKEIKKGNTRLIDHPKARPETAINKLNRRIQKLKMSKWATIEAKGRTLVFTVDEDEMQKASKLDGCYVIKSDLLSKEFTKEFIHDRYKDLAKVEIAFRTMKTGFLELRPVNVRLARRTRAHVFVVTMAYRVTQELNKAWSKFNCTVEEGIHNLSSLCTTEVRAKGKPCFHRIPEPRPEVKRLLDALNVELPKAIPSKGIVVSSRKKLVKSSKTSS